MANNIAALPKTLLAGAGTKSIITVTNTGGKLPITCKSDKPLIATVAAVAGTDNKFEITFLTKGDVVITLSSSDTTPLTDTVNATCVEGNVVVTTCKQACDYINSLGEEIQKRFKELQVFRGITINPTSTDALYSEQFDLFMDAI